MLTVKFEKKSNGNYFACNKADGVQRAGIIVDGCTFSFEDDDVFMQFEYYFVQKIVI